MKITYLHIYGFGKWQHLELHLENGNFPVMVGDNEAGKSTLRKFLLFMLFGLPPKQREYYQPKTGGPIGGRIALLLEEGEKVMVERVHDRHNGAAVCRMSNGEVKDESFLQSLIGMERGSYEAIFSFEASDLTDIHHIEKQDLGETLLNVGLTGSTQINETEKKLEQKLAERFKPHGKKPAINRRLEKIDKSAKQLREMEQEEASYQQLKEEQRELKAKMEELRKEKTSIQEVLFRQQRLLQVKGLVTSYHQHANAAEVYPENFPIEGKERLTAIKEQLLPLESERQLIIESLHETEQKLDELQSRQLPEESRLKLDELIEKMPPVEDLMRNNESLKSRVRQIETRIDHGLEDLAIDLTMDELEAYDFPFYLEEEWNQAAKQEESLEQEEERLITKESRLTAEETHAKQRHTALEEALLPEQVYRDYTGDLEAYEQRQRYEGQDDSDILSAIMENRSQQAKKMFVLTIGLSAAGILAAWLLSSVPIAIFAGLMLLGGFYIYKQSSGDIPESGKNPAGSLLSHEQYQSVRNKVDRHEEALYQLKHLNEELQRLAVERMKTEEQKQAFTSRRERLDWMLEEHRRNYPFLKDMESGHWFKLYHALKPLKEKYREYQEAVKEMDAVEQELHSYGNQVERFLTEIGWEWKGNQISAQLSELSYISDQSKEIITNLRQYEKQKEELEDRLKRVDTRMIPYQRERQILLEQGGVETEQEFLQLDHFVAKARDHSQKQKELQRQLSATLKQEDVQEYHVFEAVPDYQQLERDTIEQQKMQEALEAEQEGVRQQLADIHSRLAQLEDAEQFSHKRYRLQAERDELHEEAREWAVLQTAYQLLSRTKEIYQHSYLPEVLNRATGWFDKLTNGQYKRVYFHPEEGKLQIEAASGWKFDASELSRGTADQLYIALRLSLSAVLSRKERLPFFIDDAFVHFDHTRTSVMMEILDEMSKQHQVFLFTTRKELAEGTNESRAIKLEDQIAGEFA
ncbi:ATP-binding protein [Thalassobacillus devorans]|uniref:ATP-binding protein n=1 Tax=Thalassobacillus devorans TaxID=279813 RepID=UPI00048D4E10|nr:AAA family ATPase [Thalassobacillus devorans]